MIRNYFIQRLNNHFAWFGEWVLDHRRLVFTGFLALGLAAAVFSCKLYFHLDLLAFAPAEEGEYYRDFIKEYGNDSFIYILYRNRRHADVFHIETLQKTKKLLQELKTIPYVIKINSIINLAFLENTAKDDLKISALMEPFPRNQDEADGLKAKLLEKPAYINIYLSEDAKYAAILCELTDIPDNDAVYQETIVNKLMSILKKNAYKDFEFFPVGMPVFMSTLKDVQLENLTLVTTINLIVFITLFIILFRQIKGVIGPVTVIVVSILFVLGFMGLLDLPVTSLTPTIVALLGAIGTADAVHVISEYQIHLKAGHSNRNSIIEAVRLLGFPCLFTSITTAIGFASLVIAPMWGIRDFGLYIAFGVLAAFGISFTLLLVLLDSGAKKTESKFIALEIKRNKSIMDKALKHMVYLNSRFYKQILVVFGAVIILACYGISKVEINSSLLWQLGDRIKLYNDYQFVDQTMGGTGNFEVLLKAHQAEGIKTVNFLQTLEKIQHFADTQHGIVGKTLSVVDIVKDLNRAMHNNDGSFFKLPASDNEISQYLLLYEISGGEELEKYVSTDLSTARLSIFVKTPNAKETQGFYDELIALIESETPAEYTYSVTGTSFLMQKLMNLLGETMAKSLLLAILIISILMIFVFRSLKLGFLSMIPNLVPVVLTVGMMGVLGIWLNELTSFLGCIAIGIAVDDTIHFISRYRMEFNAVGKYEKALETTMLGVGRALTITTIILCIGFCVNMVSRMNSFFYLGLIVSACLFIALIADFFLLPSLILFFKPFGKEAK